MPRHKLTKRIFSRIQNSTRDYFDSSYHKSPSETEYFKIIAENQIVACLNAEWKLKSVKNTLPIINTAEALAAGITTQNVMSRFISNAKKFGTAYTQYSMNHR